MKKLLRGILAFRAKHLDDYRQKYAVLAKGQHPDALFIACADSRVVPNVFASTDPGDLFVVRNVGNIVAPCHHEENTWHDESTAAAIHFSLNTLSVKDIIVCGHSECGAMQALLAGRETLDSAALRVWLSHAEPSLSRYVSGELHSTLSPHNILSQVNVIQQMNHLLSYPEIAERVAAKTLRIHGWWFDLESADVYWYHDESARFERIDESYVIVDGKSE